MIQKHYKWMFPFVLLISAGLVQGFHVNDPKIKDRVPPYKGPGYRAAIDKKVPISFPSSQVSLLSWMPIGELSADAWAANDIWGYASPSGREYALIGLTSGTAFVEVTEPTNPVLVQFHRGFVSLWRDIKTYGTYAYAISEESGGIQVFDLSDIDRGTVELVKTVRNHGTDATHNVAIDVDSGFLYRAGGKDLGLRIYSLANPASPSLVGSWHDRYVHDAQAVTYNEGPWAGHQILFAFAGLNNGSMLPGVTILDVTDKANIVELAHFSHSNGVFSHQGWLSPDRRYLYLNDEADEYINGVQTTTFILNVENLANPYEVGTFSTGRAAIDHNLYTRDHLIFESNYRSGLHIFDARNPEKPVEVGHFDTWETDDDPHFNGLWSNYPNLPSGIILGSDIEKGLFVWKFEEPSAVAGFRYLFPWISNSAQFSSTLVVNNTTGTSAEVNFTARRSDGSQTQAGPMTVPARGFLELKPDDLFPEFGEGNGFSVVLSSSSAQLSGRWVTFHRASGSPSQGVAIPLESVDGSPSKRAGHAVEFGFLPGTEGFQSGPVIINTADQATQIRFYVYDADGQLVEKSTLDHVAPFVPVIPAFFLDETQNYQGIAVSSDADLSGAIFVFNAEGQTAIGNVEVITGFTEPSE